MASMGGLVDELRTRVQALADAAGKETSGSIESGFDMNKIILIGGIGILITGIIFKIRKKKNV